MDGTRDPSERLVTLALKQHGETLGPTLPPPSHPPPSAPSSSNQALRLDRHLSSDRGKERGKRKGGSSSGVQEERPHFDLSTHLDQLDKIQSYKDRSHGSKRSKVSRGEDGGELDHERVGQVGAGLIKGGYRWRVGGNTQVEPPNLSNLPSCHTFPPQPMSIQGHHWQGANPPQGVFGQPAGEMMMTMPYSLGGGGGVGGWMDEGQGLGQGQGRGMVTEKKKRGRGRPRKNQTMLEGTIDPNALDPNMWASFILPPHDTNNNQQQQGPRGSQDDPHAPDAYGPQQSLGGVPARCEEDLYRLLNMDPSSLNDMINKAAAAGDINA